MGEPLVRTSIQPQLKRSKHSLGLRSRTDSQQTEMIDGKVHQQRSYWQQTVGSVRDFAH